MNNVRNAPFLAGLQIPSDIDLSFGDIRVEKTGARQFNPNRALGALANPVQLFQDLRAEGFPINADVFSGARFYSGDRLLPEVVEKHQFPIWDFETLEELEFFQRPSRKRNYVSRLHGKSVIEVTFCPHVGQTETMGLKLTNRLFERLVFGQAVDYSAAAAQIDSLLSELFEHLSLDCGTVRLAIVGGGAGATLVSVHPSIVATDAQNLVRLALPQILKNFEVQG